MLRINRGILLAALSLCLLIPSLALGKPPEAKDENFDEVYYQYICTRLDRVHELGQQFDWPMEERAAVDRILVDGGQAEQYGIVYNDLPGEGDVPQEKALQLCQDTIMAQFGVDVAEGFEVNYHFLRQNGDGLWRLYFKPTVLPNMENYPVYLVELYPLEQVSHFEQQGWWNPAFGLADKSLKPSYISKAEAIQLAQKAILEAFGQKHRLTEELLAKYQVNGSVEQNMEGQDVWLLNFRPNDPVVEEYFAQFSADIQPETGEVLDISDDGNG